MLIVVAMRKFFDLMVLSNIYYPGSTSNAVGGHNVIDPESGQLHENTKDIVLELEKNDGIVKVAIFLS